MSGTPELADSNTEFHPQWVMNIPPTAGWFNLKNLGSSTLYNKDSIFNFLFKDVTFIIVDNPNERNLWSFKAKSYLQKLWLRKLT